MAAAPSRARCSGRTYATSCSFPSSATCPISLRYMRTGPATASEVADFVAATSLTASLSWSLPQSSMPRSRKAPKIRSKSLGSVSSLGNPRRMSSGAGYPAPCREG